MTKRMGNEQRRVVFNRKGADDAEILIRLHHGQRIQEALHRRHRQIEARVRQHKSRTDPNCHTAKYNITQLVYFERFTDIRAAIAREKTLKGWLRIRKLELIISTNPTWRDLSADWGKPIEPFLHQESPHASRLPR